MQQDSHHSGVYYRDMPLFIPSIQRREFLLPPDKSLSDVGVDHVDLAHLQQRWVGYCEGKSVDKDVRDAVMISVFTTIFSSVNVQQSILHTTNSSNQTPQVTDSVYYRFCGAAIANLLHARYNKRQACKQEHIPEELKYRSWHF